MRQAFLNTLVEELRHDPTVMLLTADTGFHVFDDFQRDFPENYLNVGIAEAAMIGVAAGLALAGRKVFVYAIAPFVTYRCLEQIRLDLCYQKLPVKIVGVGAGLTYGTAGPTHHAIEDIAVMNCLPNMTIFCPGDAWETGAAVKASMELPGPCYLRLGKSGEPAVHSGANFDFAVGRGILLRAGRDLAILATGNMLAAGVEVCRLLENHGIQAGLVSMPTIKPLDRELLVQLARSGPFLVTLEEHNCIGGFGSAVADLLLAEQLSVRLLKFGIPDCYADCAGSQEYWRGQYGLTPPQIVTKIIEYGKD
ncbi:MAG: hypothetical protein HGA96_15935 [Desulfobulbaceae bacterium]|nr:hypothetical protein [Desulfobulbaceae bacterium]